MAARPERKPSIPLEEIARWMHLPLPDAAKHLNICSAQLKRICRKHGVAKWPYRKVKSVARQATVLKSGKNLTPSAQAAFSRTVNVLKGLQDGVLSGVSLSSVKSVLNRSPKQSSAQLDEATSDAASRQSSPTVAAKRSYAVETSAGSVGLGVQRDSPSPDRITLLPSTASGEQQRFPKLMQRFNEFKLIMLIKAADSLA